MRDDLLYSFSEAESPAIYEDFLLVGNLLMCSPDVSVNEQSIRLG